MSKSFDGVDDNIDCGSNSIIDNLSRYTIAAWINPSSLGEGGFGMIATKFNVSDAAGWGLFLGATNTLRDQQNFSTTVGNWKSNDNVIVLNKWAHYCRTYDNSSTSNVPLFYKNGISITVNTISSPSGTVSADAGNDFLIGQNLKGDQTFKGLIAYVHLFNRILNASEIKSVMIFPGNITRGLVGFWPLWNGSSEPDYSGNKNSGTVTGALLSTANPPINGIFTVPNPGLVHVF